MITCGYRNGSSILPLQVQDTLFSAMVLLCHIYKLYHWLDSSLPLDILLFFCSCILVFGHVALMWCFYYVPWWFWHIIHATLVDFNCIVVENFVKIVASGKCFVTNWRNVFVTFIETDLLKGGFAKVKPCYVLLLHFSFFWFIVGVFQINIITQLL